jgi:hypothetical protein
MAELMNRAKESSHRPDLPRVSARKVVLLVLALLIIGITVVVIGREFSRPVPTLTR